MEHHEALIARECITDLLAGGFTVSVNDGEEFTVHRSAHLPTIFAAMATTDEDRLYVYKPSDPDAFGWVRFIYGNEAGTVINDYTTNLEAVIARSNAIAEAMYDGGPVPEHTEAERALIVRALQALNEPDAYDLAGRIVPPVKVPAPGADA